MKTKALILSALLMGLAGIAQAQETYSITVGGTTANRLSVLGRIDLGRLQHNADVCTRGLLPASCTQAQACVALGVTGGASCTATAALAVEARIYADSQAGREGFLVNEMVRFRVPVYYLEQKARDAAALKTWCSTANASARNQLCSLIGLPDGCNPCGNGE